MELCNAIIPRSQIDWAPWIPTLVPGALTAMRTRVIRAAVESRTDAAMRCTDAPLGMEEPAAVLDETELPDKPVPVRFTQISNRRIDPAGTGAPSPERYRNEKDASDDEEPKAECVPRVVPMIGSARRAVSRQEAGAILGVSWKTIERLINRGELKAFKVLGQWRVMVSEIDAYIERQATEQKKRIGA